MSSPSSSPPTRPSLASLPTELLVSICADFAYADIQSLRYTSRIFSAILSPPSEAELLRLHSATEARRATLIGCGGCLRLFSSTRFSTRMVIRHRTRTRGRIEIQPSKFLPECCTVNTYSFPPAPKQQLPAVRLKEPFCNRCGSRPLPGPYRYQLGEIWDTNSGAWFLRCESCGKCE